LGANVADCGERCPRCSPALAGRVVTDLLWVKEEHRGQGHGQRLLALAEQEARQRGAKGAYLDTFSFQAPDFYRKKGYEVFGVMQDFPEGHQRYYFRKQL
jgi:GNAT superfamily N-acetyltransferase